MIAYGEWPAGPHQGQAVISCLLAVLRGHCCSSLASRRVTRVPTASCSGQASPPTNELPVYTGPHLQGTRCRLTMIVYGVRWESIHRHWKGVGVVTSRRKRRVQGCQIRQRVCFVIAESFFAPSCSVRCYVLSSPGITISKHLHRRVHHVLSCTCSHQKRGKYTRLGYRPARPRSRS
jgi:hypothetical protein